MTINVEIKPCPFCGNTNLIVDTSAVINGDDDKNNYAVCCSANAGGCGATSGYAVDKITAINKWNRRSDAK